MWTSRFHRNQIAVVANNRILLRRTVMIFISPFCKGVAPETLNCAIITPLTSTGDPQSHLSHKAQDSHYVRYLSDAVGGCKLSFLARAIRLHRMQLRLCSRIAKCKAVTVAQTLCRWNSKSQKSPSHPSCDMPQSVDSRECPPGDILGKSPNTCSVHTEFIATLLGCVRSYLKLDLGALADKDSHPDDTEAWHLRAS